MNSLESSLRRSGYVGLVGFIGIAVILAVIYILLYFQNQNLQQEKAQLLDRINAQKTKEGLILAIKDRTKIVEKARANQKPWTEVLDLVTTLASPPALSSITVDEQNKVVISVQAGSLDEVNSMVNAIILQDKEKRLRSPQLVSLQFGKKGEIDLAFSFYALFPTKL